MTWCIDKYLEKTLTEMKLCPGVDVTFECHLFEEKDFCLSVFWHAPSTNLRWYPICQIDSGHTTIFHSEGSENPEHFEDVLVEAWSFLNKWLQN